MTKNLLKENKQYCIGDLGITKIKCYPCWLKCTLAYAYAKSKRTSPEA